MVAAKLVNLQFKINRMSLAIKLLIIFFLLYLGARYITKPFRDVIKQAKRETEKMRQDYQQKQEQKQTSKTDELGEYIDFEEIE